jgi:hypothetical protein
VKLNYHHVFGKETGTCDGIVIGTMLTRTPITSSKMPRLWASDLHSKARFELSLWLTCSLTPASFYHAFSVRVLMQLDPGVARKTR